MKIMFYYIKKHPILWIIGLIIPGFANLTADLTLAYAMQSFTEIFSDNINNIQFSNVLNIMLTTGAIVVVSTVIEDIARYIFAIFIVKSENNIKSSIFLSLVKAKYNELNSLNRGEIIVKYNDDNRIAVNLITWDIFAILYPLTLGIGYITAIFLANILIGFIMLILVSLVIFLNFIFMNKYAKIEKEGLKIRDKYVSSTESAIRGKMSIRVFSIQNNISNLIVNNSLEMKNNANNKAKLTFFKKLTIDGLYLSCNSLMAPFACVLAAYNIMPLMSVALIVQLSRYIITFTGFFGSALTSFKTHIVSLNRLKDLILIKTEDDNQEKLSIKENNCQNDNIDNLLKFNKVEIKYGDNIILSDINISINKNEIVVIKGPSGSGKSSIIKTLLGFTEYMGNVDFLGLNVKNYNIKDIRNLISYVPENSEIFDGTVLDNLQFVKPNATIEEFEEALSKASLSKDILYKEVGVKGEKLSGGQRQRVSIARALLKNSPLFIFDEPTASLDDESENQILKTILSLKNIDKGIIIITHKTSTANIGDKLYNVDIINKTIK